MSEKEYKRILATLKEASATAASASPAESQAFLVRVGVFDKTGKIAKAYKK